MANEQPKFNIGDNVVWYKDFDSKFKDGVLCTVIAVGVGKDERDIVYSLIDEYGNITNNVSQYILKRSVYDDAIMVEKTERRIKIGFLTVAILVLAMWIALLIKTFIANQPFDDAQSIIGMFGAIACGPALGIMVRFAYELVKQAIYGTRF